MSEEKKWKVYCYTNTVNGKKYVGITSTSLAMRSGQKGKKYFECPYFGKAIKKYGWDAFSVEVLRDNLTEAEAAVLEYDYIEALGTRDIARGYNIRPGGYDHHEFSEEGRKRFVESHSGGNAHHARRTSVYDLSGRLIRTFETGCEAAKYLGVSDVSEARKKRRGTLAGHIVRYESDFNGIKQLPKGAIYKAYDYRLLNKAINQYDLKGHYIKTFPSSIEAAKEVSPSGNGKQSICSCLKNRHRTAYGFIWKYADENGCDDILPYKEYVPKSGTDLPQSIPVQQLSLDGSLIAEYGSIREAHEKTGASAANIRRHLLGKATHPTKFIWKRAE